MLRPSIQNGQPFLFVLLVIKSRLRYVPAQSTESLHTVCVWFWPTCFSKKWWKEVHQHCVAHPPQPRTWRGVSELRVHPWDNKKKVIKVKVVHGWDSGRILMGKEMSWRECSEVLLHTLLHSAVKNGRRLRGWCNDRIRFLILHFKNAFYNTLLQMSAVKNGRRLRGWCNDRIRFLILHFKYACYNTLLQMSAVKNGRRLRGWCNDRIRFLILHFKYDFYNTLLQMSAVKNGRRLRGWCNDRIRFLILHFKYACYNTLLQMGSERVCSAVQCCGACEMSERMGPERACSSVQWWTNGRRLRGWGLMGNSRLCTAVEHGKCLRGWVLKEHALLCSAVQNGSRLKGWGIKEHAWLCSALKNGNPCFT